MTLSAPELLTVDCEVEAFTSGVESLDTWLRRRALKNQVTGASRTFVACDDRRVVAYYALASSAVAGVEATGRFRGNYEHIGFDTSALDPMTLMITLADLKASLEKL